jgi:hypothetical protein
MLRFIYLLVGRGKCALGAGQQRADLAWRDI